MYKVVCFSRFIAHFCISKLILVVVMINEKKFYSFLSIGSNCFVSLSTSFIFLSRVFACPQLDSFSQGLEEKEIGTGETLVCTSSHSLCPI